MKILHISDYYHTGDGHPINNFCEKLAERGHNVNVYTSDISLLKSEKETFKSGVKITRFRSLKLFGKVFYPGAILKLLTQENPDVIHTHVAGFFSTFISGLLKKIRRYPLVATADFDISEPQPSRLKSLYILFYRKIPVQMADVITTFTKKEKDEFSKRFGIDKRKIVVLPIGIHFEKFSAPPKKDVRKELGLEGKFIVLNVSYGIPKKNLESIIKVMDTIKNENVIFMHIGDFLDIAYKKYLKKLVFNLGLETRIIFLEGVTYDELPDYYKASNVFVQAGYRESYAIPILEAMTSGIPVISTESGIASEVIEEGKTGFIMKSEKDITEKIELLVKAHELRKQMGENCKKIAKEYDWQITIDKLEELYRGIK